MAPRPLRRIASLGLAAALCACFGSYERAVEDTRAQLIGLSGKDLRRCLGVPTDFDREDGVEYLTYRWVFDRDRPGTVHVGSGGIGGIVVGRQDAGGGYDPLGFPRELEEKEFCQLDFQLEGRRGVTKVTASGQNDQGMRTDGPCLLRAKRCTELASDTEK
ncbi:MAG TPA: hypothetical protein VMR31_16830 [Myxococcota bacterium]|nr:hypothetical protein [Myxococcota bacterium]